MIVRLFLTAIWLNLFSNLFAQLPQSAIYLLHIDNPSDTSWTISKIEYLSSFNPKGYNNQPYFKSPTDLLASVRLSDSDNTDIYHFDLIQKTYTNVTKSGASEYSPRTSSTNAHHITCVSVPKNDTSIQNLVEINLDNGVYSKIIFDKFAKIGYYRYVKDQIWVCYLVDKPDVLSICDEGKLIKKIFASSIGRCFEVLNKSEVLFVHKITEDHWFLKVYNFATEKSKTIAEMPPGTEDFVLSENDHVLCASNSKILKLSKDNRWQIVIDLKPLNINNMNRLAISKNLMAIVSMLKS